MLESRKNINVALDSEQELVKINFDGFLRNFFIRNKMNQTLENFQQEWYEMKQRGK